METGFRNYASHSAGEVVPVCVSGAAQEVQRISEIGAQAQTRYDFRLSRGIRSLSLRITDDHERDLFSLGEGGVSVSTWQSEGIARYTGMERAAYFLLCGALGLLQYRALALNPLLQPDDFLYESERDCLFSLRPVKQEYALLLERPRICAGCVQFFDCLGCEPEVGALLDILEHIRGSHLSRATSN